MLQLCTGRLKGEGGDDESPVARGRKRRRTEAVGPSPSAADTIAGLSQETATGYAESQNWQPSQGQEFAMGGNVDPGLQMPQTG